MNDKIINMLRGAEMEWPWAESIETTLRREYDSKYLLGISSKWVTDGWPYDGCPTDAEIKAAVDWLEWPEYQSEREAVHDRALEWAADATDVRTPCARILWAMKVIGHTAIKHGQTAAMSHGDINAWAKTVGEEELTSAEPEPADRL